MALIKKIWHVAILIRSTWQSCRPVGNWTLIVHSIQNSNRCHLFRSLSRVKHGLSLSSDSYSSLFSSPFLPPIKAHRQVQPKPRLKKKKKKKKTFILFERNCPRGNFITFQERTLICSIWVWHEQRALKGKFGVKKIIISIINARRSRDKKREFDPCK